MQLTDRDGGARTFVSRGRHTRWDHYHDAFASTVTDQECILQSIFEGSAIKHLARATSHYTMYGTPQERADVGVLVCDSAYQLTSIRGGYINAVPTACLSQARNA